MRKSVVYKEKYSDKCEIPPSGSNDGTAARTRPFSYDEIMLRRKSKKQSGNVEDHRVDSEVISGKGAQSVTERVESDKHRHRGIGGNEQRDSKEALKGNSRAIKDRDRNEYKESNNPNKKSQVGSDNAVNRRKERGVNENRKNQDRSNEESNNEYGMRHVKNSELKDRDRNVEKNRGKSEHVSKKRTQNGYDEKTRDHDSGKKRESRTWHDSDTSDKKQKKGTSESRHEDLKLKPSPRGHKQRLYDIQEHEELTTHSSKDKVGKFDPNIDKKQITNNGSSNKSKRHETSTSKLGGYSPRKRRSEVVIKTPSPTNHSPEKKPRWDPPLVKTEEKFVGSLNKINPSNRPAVSNVVPVISSIPKPNFGPLSSFPLMLNASVDSIQLTQATRPKRRVYVENLPSSASESAIMEWLSGYLRPSGINLVQGMSPCISCIVNKEKGQALVEFLTPEDASTALSLDGRSFSGNILKIRRPKDYVETTTGVSEKPVAGAVSVKNIVEDSPNKIFIGGISKRITSEMLMEIASAFGPLKAFHFEADADLDGPSAFIEYSDQSVTVKACVGLNGMKLGGEVLTVTQATPDALSVENHGDRPFYGIPEHARPLLEKPTQVLKLTNLVDPDSLSSLSEPELEEILEDVRLECTRFGMVKSINIIKHTEMPTSSDTAEVEEVDVMTDDHSESDKEPEDGKTHHDDDKPKELHGIINGDNKHENKIVKEDETSDTIMAVNLEDDSNQISSAIDQMELNDCKPLKPEVEESGSDLNDGFEVGCVLVEYKRTEASSMAAHCLHGRVFDGRTVSVGFVAHSVYCARFRK